MIDSEIALVGYALKVSSQIIARPFENNVSEFNVIWYYTLGNRYIGTRTLLH